MNYPKFLILIYYIIYSLHSGNCTKNEIILSEHKSSEYWQNSWEFVKMFYMGMSKHADDLCKLLYEDEIFIAFRRLTMPQGNGYGPIVDAMKIIREDINKHSVANGETCLNELLLARAVFELFHVHIDKMEKYIEERKKQFKDKKRDHCAIQTAEAGSKTPPCIPQMLIEKQREIIAIIIKTIQTSIFHSSQHGKMTSTAASFQLGPSESAKFYNFESNYIAGKFNLGIQLRGANNTRMHFNRFVNNLPGSARLLIAVGEGDEQRSILQSGQQIKNVAHYLPVHVVIDFDGHVEKMSFWDGGQDHLKIIQSSKNGSYKEIIWRNLSELNPNYEYGLVVNEDNNNIFNELQSQSGSTDLEFTGFKSREPWV